MVKDEKPPPGSTYYVDATGHQVYRGQRWHFPKTGEPTRCGVEGCPRVLGQPSEAEASE